MKGSLLTVQMLVILPLSVKMLMKIMYGTNFSHIRKCSQGK